MIGHGIDLNHLLLFLSDDAGNIFVELFFVFVGDEPLSCFDGKDDVYVKLGVCVWHFDLSYGFCFVDIALRPDESGFETGAKTLVFRVCKMSARMRCRSLYQKTVDKSTAP